MKKALLSLLILFKAAFGAVLLDLTSFEADFTQQINDGENKVVTYEGKIYTKKPSLAMWSYTKPIKKDVYVNATSVMIVEPELEQVIVRKIRDDFNIFELLKNAKEINTGEYEAYYKNIRFKLYFDGKDIQKLIYKDNFENLVTIKFHNQKYNTKIDTKLFQATIPDEYDMIVE